MAGQEVYYATAVTVTSESVFSRFSKDIKLWQSDYMPSRRNQRGDI